MVYTGTEIAPGRAKFAGYTPIHGIHLYMVYTGTEGNPVNRRSLKRQRSIRSKETQWKSGGQPTQVRGNGGPYGPWGASIVSCALRQARDVMTSACRAKRYCPNSRVECCATCVLRTSRESASAAGRRHEGRWRYTLTRDQSDQSLSASAAGRRHEGRWNHPR